MEDYTIKITNSSPQSGLGNPVIDSQDNTFIRHGCDIWVLPKGADHFSMLVGSQGQVKDGLIGRDASIHYCDSLEIDFDLSHASQELHLALNLPVAGIQQARPAVQLKDNEGLWLADQSSLRLISRGKLITVVRGQTNSSQPGCDGYASIRYGLREHQTALLKGLSHIVRLRHRPIIVCQESYSKEPFSVRLVDMTTWGVSTLVGYGTSFQRSPYIESQYDLSLRGPSDDVVSLRASGGLFSMNVDTGEIKEGSVNPSFPDSYSIPSSPSNPAYVLRDAMAFHDRVGHLLRPLREDKIPISSARGCAYLHSSKMLYFTNGHRLVPTDQPHKDLDVSCFFNNDSLPLDLKFKHELSGASWKASSHVLKLLHPTLDIPSLVDAVQHTSFPVASVEALLTSLHYKSLSKAARTTNNPSLWTHVHFMWQQSGLNTGWLLNSFLWDYVLWRSDSDLCRILIDIWNDEILGVDDENPILLILSSHVRSEHFELFRAQIALQPSAKNTGLAMAVAMRLDYDDSHLLSFSVAVGLPPIDLIYTRNTDIRQDPWDFCFSAAGSFITADAFYLYARWKWFRRLMDIRSYEYKTRVAVLPEWVTSNMLCAILESIHSVCTRKLDSEEAMILLENGAEFDLWNDEYVPVKPFEDLFARCQKQCFGTVNASNCFAQLALLESFGMTEQVKIAIDWILSHPTEVSILEAIKHLTPETLHLLQQRMLSNPHKKAGNV